MPATRAQRRAYRKLVCEIFQSTTSIELTGVEKKLLPWRIDEYGQQQQTFSKTEKDGVTWIFNLNGHLTLEGDDRSAVVRAFRDLRERQSEVVHLKEGWTRYYLPKGETGRLTEVYQNTSDFTEIYECGRGVRIFVNRGAFNIATVEVPIDVDADSELKRIARAVVYGSD